jgi:hypothetical protein
MTRDDIIRMAREADLIDFRDADDDPHTAQMVEFFERFAAIVAAAEREKHLQEPVAWMDVDEKSAMSSLRYWSEPDKRHEVALYTRPPAVQPTGKAPCERHCEANAFKIEIRGLRKQLEAPLPTRKPLTEDQIVKCFRSVWPTGGVIFTTGAIAFAKAIEAAHQISGARQMVCEWKREDNSHMGDTWHSACGQLRSFIGGTPADNWVRYCHGCGRQVAEVHNPDQGTAP